MTAGPGPSGRPAWLASRRTRADERDGGRTRVRQARSPAGAALKQLTDASETEHRTAWNAEDLTVCGTCHAADVAREEAAAEAVRLLVAAVPEPQDEQEPGWSGGWFRRRS